MKLFEIKQAPESAPSEHEIADAVKKALEIIEKAEKMKAVHKSFQLNPRTIDGAKESVKTLADAIEAKKIWNTDWQYVKQIFSSILERGYERISDAEITDMKNPNDHMNNRFASLIAGLHIDDLYYYHPGLSTLNKGIKFFDKMKDDKSVSAQFRDCSKLALEFLQTMKVISTALDYLKPLIEKGRKPKEPDPNQFKNRLGSEASQKLIRTQLKKTVDPLLDEFEQELVRYFTGLFNSIKKEKSIPMKEMSVMGPRWDIFKRCFKYEVEGHEGKGVYKNGTFVYPDDNRTFVNIKPEKDWKDTIDKMSKDQRDIIETHFLSKNVLKLSNIVDKKGNLKKITPMPTHAPKLSASGVATIEAGYDFEFADDSYFNVTNKVIINRSSSGKWFYQYPTTFHDVKLANGEKIKSSSEEKMIKAFAGGSDA